MSLLLILYMTASLIQIMSSQNCSAIDSYVQMVSSSNLSTTLTSSQALFPPYAYYIPFTELVLLDKSIDDSCNPNGITTDISNKIVLLFESVGNCSNHYKVSVAEQNNAIAVLIANNDISGQVITIIDDENIITNIPMRSIPRNDGVLLSDEITSEFIEIEFGCFQSDYPSIICILDTLGDYWYLDGEYQRQAHIKKNDHPVWKKEGYVWLLSDLYIFLHDANGDNDWYWTITFDPDFNDDESIRAICTIDGISKPSECTAWNTSNIYNNAKRIPFSSYSQLNISDGLCTITDSYVCMESKQSTLVGLDGTYKQFNKATPYWFRELDDCDTRPGWLLFDEGYFILWDTFNGWIIAQCLLDSNYSDNWEYAKLLPSLCTDWETIANSTLEQDNRLPDNTFTIKMDTQCIDYQCVKSQAPNTLCMEKNSIMHGLLEGEYNKTDTIGSTYNTPEYSRTNTLSRDGSLIDIYIWFYGEVDEDTYIKWWVISSQNLTTAVEKNGNVSIYGYCEASVGNPLDCNAGWSFYFGGAFHSDHSFDMYSGSCKIDTTLEPRVWPEYVCIGLKNESLGSDSSYLPWQYFVGGYVINRTGTVFSDGNPHWVKPYNDNWGYEIYLYFDAFYGWWQLGSGLHIDLAVQLICFQENGYTPIECMEWYDYFFTEMVNMHLYECTANDIITASPTTSPTLSPTTSPTLSPTTSPSATPTSSPTSSPTASPTSSPTSSPTASPTASPTKYPTAIPTSSPTYAPSHTLNIICLSGSNGMQSFLEGTYEQTGIVGDKYGTKEYQPTEALVYDGKEVNVYIWYYGEIGDDNDAQKWVISPYSYTKAKNSNNIVPLYGYCQGKFNTPQQCTSCWQFYWSASAKYVGKYYTDCTFRISADLTECEEDTDTDEVIITWPEYVCLSIDETMEDESNFNLKTLIGGYRRNATEKEQRLSDRAPFYSKQINDYTKQIQYIWYDAFYNYWYIGPEMYVNSTLVCMQNDEDYFPSQCEIWYDTASIVINNIIIMIDGCTENDILTESKDNTLSKAGIIVIIVLTVSFVIGCCMIIFWYLRYRKNRNRNIGKVVPQQMIDDPVGGTIEMDAPFTNKNKMNDFPQTGGMDMSPLNVKEGRDTIIADYDDDTGSDDDDDTGSGIQGATEQFIE